MNHPKLILTVLFALFLFKGFSQDRFVDTTLFTVEELQEDFIFWRNQLEKNHPILYQYNSKESFEKYFDSLYAEIDEEMSRAEFFRLIGPSSFFIKCSHSQVQSTAKMSDCIMNSPIMIPVDIRWYSDTAYISYNYTGLKELNEGTIVRAINGVKMSDMHAQFLTLLPRDGYSTQYPKYWVNRQFYHYYHLWYDMHEIYEFEILTNGKIEKVSALGMSVEAMDSIIEDRPEIGLEKPEKIQLEIIDSIKTAYLQIGSFTAADIKSNNGKKWKKMIDSCFREIDISKSESLIIDLQENGGGSPNFAWYLCRSFMNEEFVFKAEFRKLRNHSKSEFDERSKETLLKDKTAGITQPLKNAFKGEVYLLIDGGSSSASAEVASVVMRYNRGTIIGEEAGGSPWLISSRWFYVRTLRLPNTKLIYSAPRRTYVLGADFTKDTGFGTIPGIIVQPTIKTYLAGKDLALIKALELIESKHKQR